MMISPKTYIEDFKEKSYEELLEEKKRLNKEIEEFENGKNKFSSYIISPSPDVRYQCNLEYMAELCNLISEKYRKNQTLIQISKLCFDYELNVKFSYSKNLTSSK